MALSFWLTLALVWVVFLVPVLRLRRRVDRHAWPAWTATLHGELAAHYAYLAEVLEGNAELVRSSAALAGTHAQRGAHAVARQRLGILFGLVESCTAAMIERLDEWLVVCRAAVTLYPVEPLPLKSLKLPALRGISVVHRAAHAVVVTSGERFRLRLRVLDWALHRLRGIARRARGRLMTRVADDLRPSDWRTAQAVTHDFAALSDEALVSAHGLLQAAHTVQNRA